MGDGELNEGSVWEAAMMASKHALDGLVAIVDYNKLQSYGAVDDVLPLEPLADKWRSFGFAVTECDGHDVHALQETLSALPLEQGKPTILIAHTIKGRGVDVAEHSLQWHHKSSFDLAAGEAMRAALKRN